MFFQPSGKLMGLWPIYRWFTLKWPDRMPSRNQTRAKIPHLEIPHSQQQKPPWPWSDFPATFDYQRITNHIPIIIPIVDG
jgi:hypothetical protein